MTKREILIGMGLTDEQVTEALAKLATVPTGRRPFGLKVAEKSKGISVYGIRGRFPLTFYASEFLALLDHAEDIRSFIDENRDVLAWPKQG